MYEEHYGLNGRPFALTPDSRFWFDTATHKKAMAYLGYGLSQGEGFIVITGDIGAGKTTLVGHLVDTIDAERLNVIKIVSTQIAADDLLRTVAAGLGIEAAGMSKAAVLAAIERALHAVARGGRRTLLIVDEGQALPTDSLEELRMLSNFQAGGYAILQIFLLGQPEFREKLGDPGLEQLRQRVIATHHLGPMAGNEIESYLTHRLGVVGWTGNPSFAPDALARMHDWSGGVPRRLNQLASRVLLFGAVEGITRFTGEDIAAVIADLDGDTLPRSRVASAPPAPAPLPDLLMDEPADDFPPFPNAVIDPLPEAAPAPAFTIEADPVFDVAEPEREEPEPEPEPEPEAEPEAEPEPETAVETAPATGEAALLHRLAEVEARLEAQDVALRRVLTLLVDWVEGTGARPDLASLG